MKPRQTIASNLYADLARIEPSLRRNGLSEQELLRLLTTPVGNVPTEVILANEGDLVTEHPESSGRTGFQAFERGEVAACIMAGRLGHVLENVPGLGISCLAMKVAQGIVGALGKTFSLPLWIIVSPDERADVENYMTGIVVPNVTDVRLVEQHETYLFDPMKRIIFEEPGVPLVGPMGTGDVARALIDDGCIQDFVANGGKYVIVMNANNLMATPDIAMVGHHIERGVDITCEVVKREPGMSGGTIVWAGDALTIAEDVEWDCPPFGDEGYLNTNTFVMNVNTLTSGRDLEWRLSRRRRTICDRVVDGFESNIGQLTESFKTDYVEVPNEVRYLPIRTHEDVQGTLEVFKRLGLVTMVP